MAKLAKIWDGENWVEFISAITDPYPDQQGNANKFLATDGQYPYWTDAPGASFNSFSNINTPAGTDPVADSSTDTLNITASNGMVVTGDSSTDTVDFSTNATASNTASTIVARDADQAFGITAIDFDTADTITNGLGRLHWEAEEGTLQLGMPDGVVQSIGMEFYMPPTKNNSGVEIPSGSFVMATGAQGDRITIAKAITNGTVDPMFMIGVATENIGIGSETGIITVNGTVRDVDTSDWVVGTVLYPDPANAGGLTSTQPTAPNIRTPIAIVLRQHEETGRIYVRMTNGSVLGGTDSNVKFTSPTDNHIITYNGTTSLWENQGLAAAIQEVDGASSGIDADLLDGQHGSYYLDTSESTQTKSGDLIITGNLTVNGTTTTVNSTTVSIDDKNIELGSVDNPSDNVADGGGITLKGTTDKTINWVLSTQSWTISDNLDLALGKVIKINGVGVLSATQYVGNAATVTNGVYTTGLYENPVWIDSLDWSKIVGTPNSLSGYGIDTSLAKTELILENVENVAISTWAGSGNISTLGTITTGVWQGTVIDASYISSDIARINSPNFVGTVSLPSTTSIGDVSDIEISYLDGTTSNIQLQLNAKLSSSLAATTYAPINSPTFTTSATLPTNTSIGTVSSTEIGYLSGVTSSIQTQINLKAPLESPTFTGTVSGITKSMVGLANVDNTSDINKPISTAQQTALDNKLNISGGTLTGFITLNADPTQALHAATKQYVDEVAEGLQSKPSVEIATTENLSATYNNGVDGVGATLTANSNGPFPEIDGITLATTNFGENGVLVKNQTNAFENGRYNLTQVGDASNPWILTRCGLCDEPDEIPGSYIFVKSGTLNSGSGWVLVVSDPPTFTVGTDNISAFQFSGAGTITPGTNIEVNGSQISTINNPTFSGLITASSGVAFSDGTQTKQGVPSISSFISKTASYTLDDLTLRDNIIEVDSTSATTITIPDDATLSFPIGSSIDIIQINTGQVTIAGAAGVTVNSTPGLKLREQWSSCTLLKRSANTWIVYGDLTA